MNKKYLIILLVCIMLVLPISVVNAAPNNNDAVSDRHIAIACALSYAPLQEGKTMKQNFDLGNITIVSDVVNLVNGKVNLHDFATIEEVDDWIVDDYHNKEISEKSMAVFTLRKGNNIIIAFRGTDFEALADVVYGFTNYHNQEEYADKYVLGVLEKYSKMDGNFNIYVAGHSLGGYLAQTAGATMEQNINKYPNLRLARIVSFNGIGINFLTWLGEKINYGNQAETIATLKKLGSPEEGRLIEYYTYGDLVSALGVHYGEMRMLLPSIDSIAYHRENNVLLANLNQKLNFGAKLEEIIKKDRLNIFKTEIHGAKQLYKLDESILAFLVLTHEADAFVTIDLENSQQDVEIKVLENQKGLVAQLTEGKTKFEIKDSTTLKAITNYASVKKYEWYVSSDKNSLGDLVFTSTIDVNDPKYNANAKPTNTYDVNINDFEKGETKYYTIKAYYDDDYTTSRYKKNPTTNQYEYEVIREKSRNYDVEETKIEVTYKTSVVRNWVDSLLGKNNFISGIFDTVNKLKEDIKQGNFFKGISNMFTGLFESIFKGQTIDLISGVKEGKFADIITNFSTQNLVNLLGYFTDMGKNIGNYATETIESISNILFNKEPEQPKDGATTDFSDFINNEENNDEEDNKNDIIDNTPDIDLSEYQFTNDLYTYKIAITKDKLLDALKKIENNEIYSDNELAANITSKEIASYYVYIMTKSLNSVSLNGVKLEDYNNGTGKDGTEEVLKTAINNRKPAIVRIGKNDWVTCVGYKGEGTDFKDFLFIDTKTGRLEPGGTDSVKQFYPTNRTNAIYIY